MLVLSAASSFFEQEETEETEHEVMHFSVISASSCSRIWIDCRLSGRNVERILHQHLSILFFVAFSCLFVAD